MFVFFIFNGYFSIFVYNLLFVWSLYVYKYIDSKDIKEGKEVLLKMILNIVKWIIIYELMIIIGDLNILSFFL